jgi:hypothetical protein
VYSAIYPDWIRKPIFLEPFPAYPFEIDFKPASWYD